MKDLCDIDGELIDGLEFCSKVYDLFEHVRLKPKGRDRRRPRMSHTEKRLLEELFPICRYVQTYYGAGRYISVRWIDGNQSFDAELYQRGDYIDLGYHPKQAYLEVTTAMHKNEHWTWNLPSSIELEGIVKRKEKDLISESESVAYSNQKHVNSFVPILLEQLKKKSEIEYPGNTSLIIQCHLNTPYSDDDWSLLVRNIKCRLHKLVFRELLVYDSTTERAERLM